ncbi:MAG: 3'-5' exonuclease [Planctomycetota bacterium]|jgi:DNA polymerase III epsilon subunit family exonuclease
MQPRRYKNLVPDSPLHRELEKLLRESDGRASLEAICEQVLQLPCTDPALAATLVGTMIEGDPRMQFSNGGVKWVEMTSNSTWKSCRRFAVIDLETTNGPRHEQRIIEIGLCRVEDGAVRREWTSLINPERPIPYWVRQLTGITDGAVRRAPRFEEILPVLLDELDDSILVAHHARFDVSCLNAELSRLWGKRLSNPYLCTVELSRRFLAGSENYRLETLSQWLGLTHTRPHRAHSDARATAELFCHLLGTVEAPWREFLRPRASGEHSEKAETNPPPVS